MENTMHNTKKLVLTAAAGAFMLGATSLASAQSSRDMFMNPPDTATTQDSRLVGPNSRSFSANARSDTRVGPYAYQHGPAWNHPGPLGLPFAAAGAALGTAGAIVGGTAGALTGQPYAYDPYYGHGHASYGYGPHGGYWR
jgi:hypothetical protein